MINYVAYVNSSLLTADEKGVITTTSSPQTFEFIDSVEKKQFVVSSLRITADSTSLNDVKIKVNNDNSVIYITKGDTFELNDMEISSITCVSAVGTKFSFEAGAIKKTIIK